MKRLIILLIMCLLGWGSLSVSTTVRADDILWNLSVPNGNWNDSSNWINGSGGANRVPTGDDHVLLYTDNRSISVTYNSNNPSINLLNLGAPSGIENNPYSGTMTLNLTGGTLSAIGNPLEVGGNQPTIGGTGRGVLDQTGGTFLISGLDGSSPTPLLTGSLVLGSETTGIGTYNLSGTGSLSVALFEMVGANGTGTFNQSAGSHSVGTNLFLGYSSGSNGTHSLSGTGNLIVTGSEAVGYNGTGIFNQSGGTNDIGKNLIISRFPPGSSGTYNLSGGTLNVNGEIVNNGTFNQTNGGNSVKGTFTTTGTYNLSNGTLNANGGFANNGTFNQTGGTNTTANVTTATVGSSGTYNLGGGMFSTNGGFVNNGAVNMTLANTTGQIILGNGTNMTNNNLFNITGQGNSGGVVSNGGWASLSNSIQTNQTPVQSVAYAAPEGISVPVTGTISNFSSVSVSNTLAMWGYVAPATDPDAIVEDGQSVSLDYDIKGVSFRNYGGYVSDPSTSIFANLINESSGYLRGGAGDEFLISGDFENKSTQNSLWDTTGALLGFVGDPGTMHNYLLSGDAPLFSWGGLYLADRNYLQIPGYFSNGLNFDKIILENISQLRDITSNSDIYYNALLDLNGQSLDPTGYQINGPGRLIPALQPTSFNLFLPLILSQ